MKEFEKNELNLSIDYDKEKSGLENIDVFYGGEVSDRDVDFLSGVLKFGDIERDRSNIKFYYLLLRYIHWFNFIFTPDGFTFETEGGKKSYQICFYD